MSNYSTPLTSIEQAKAFIADLMATDKIFHLEDAPSEIVNGFGVPIFTEEEAANMELRVEELYSFDWEAEGFECPIGYVLHLDSEEN